MIKEPYFETNSVTQWWSLVDTDLNDEEFRWYGFRSISFVHVCLAKLFFLPIILIILGFFLLIAFLLKLIIKKKATNMIFNISFYCLFFNVPLWYFLEMFQDIMIAALVNIGMIGKKTHSLAIQVVNIILSIIFLLLSVVSLILIILMIIRWKYPKMLWELFFSLREAWMPILLHICLFGITRFIMALLIAIGYRMPSTVTAFVFSLVCLFSIGAQLPFRIYKSVWMNILNITLET